MEYFNMGILKKKNSMLLVRLVIFSLESALATSYCISLFVMVQKLFQIQSKTHAEHSKIENS